MMYYRVKEKYGDYSRITNSGKDNGYFIGNELYTQKERDRFRAPDGYFDIVNIPKYYTFKMFGARFQYHKN